MRLPSMFLLLCAIFLGVPELLLSAQPGKNPIAPQQPATQSPGAPSRQPVAVAPYVAYRDALRQPAVRAASESEIRAQLRGTAPIAFVNGYWVVPIDLSRVYNQPTIRDTLSIQVKGPIGGLHLGLVFIANEFADSFQIPRADFLNMLGVDAIRVKATGSWLHPSAGGVNIMTAIDWIGGAYNWFIGWWQNYQNQQQQEQTKKNCQDKGPSGDCDNDGVPNGEDKCPYDPDCKTKKGSFVGCVIVTCQTFVAQFGEQMDSAIYQVTQQLRYSAQTGNLVALSQGGQINIAFPPGP